jgi:hypothetical protein
LVQYTGSFSMQTCSNCQQSSIVIAAPSSVAVACATNEAPQVLLDASSSSDPSGRAFKSVAWEYVGSSSLQQHGGLLAAGDLAQFTISTPPREIEEVLVAAAVRATEDSAGIRWGGGGGESMWPAGMLSQGSYLKLEMLLY